MSLDSDGSQPNETRFGHYQIIAPLGSGQHGIVSHAIDTRTGRHVALKTIRVHSPHEDQLLKQEFRRVSDVSHPNLVFPLELASQDGITALAMEYIQGRNLLDSLRTYSGPRRFAAINRSLAQLLLALEALHERGLLHRDVKPANILVTDAGRLVLLDYGFVSSQSWSDGTLIGTPAYVAPEVARGEPATRPSDWYAVGTMLYQYLAGSLPFAPDELSNFVAKAGQLTAPRLTGTDIPPALADLVAALLVPDPQGRAGARAVRDYLGLGHAEVFSDPAGRDDATAFVGRELELARLHDLLASTSAERVTIVEMHGAPGMGKSKLLSRWIGEVEERSSAWCLHGRCYERDATPYQALDDVLNQVAHEAAAAPHARLPELDGSQLDAIARSFPVIGNALSATAGPLLDPMLARRHAFAALALLLSALALGRRLLLTIDDLQWGDSDSADLLDVLVAGLTVPLMVVLTYRSDERHRSHFLDLFLGSERPHARAVELRVDPLPPNHARALVAALAPSMETSELEPIVADSEGCPFLLEMLASSTAAHAIDRAAGPLRTGVVLRPRLGEISALQTDALQLLCVSGRPVRREVLEAAMADERLAGAVTLLRSERLVRTSGIGPTMSIDIYHDRIRSAYLEHVGMEARKTLHRRLADALVRSEPTDLESIARHFADSDAPEHALAYAHDAAARAFQQLAFDRAADLYQLALTVAPPDEPRRATLRLGLASALAHSGRGRQAGDAYLACAAADADGRELRRLAADQYIATGHLDAGIPIARALLKESGAHWPVSRLRASIMLISSFVRTSMSKPRTTSWSGPALDPRMRFRIELLMSLGRGLSSYDALRGPGYILQAVRLAVKHGHDDVAARGMSYLGFAIGLSGRAKHLRQATRWIDAAKALATARDDALGQHFATVVEGIIAVCRLRWSDAIATLDRGVAGLQRECVGAHWEIAIARATALHAAYCAGDMTALGTRIESDASNARRLGDLASETEAQLYFAAIYTADDVPQRALELIAKTMRAWHASEFQFQHWIALRFEVYARLYASDVDAELVRRFELGALEARRAGQLSMQVMRVEVAVLRALLALAIDKSPSPRTRKTVGRSIKALAQEPTCPTAEALAALLVAQLTHDLTDLRAAHRQLSACDMRAHAASVELRIAEHARDGTQGARAEAELRTLGIANPARYARMLLPAG